MKYGIILNKHYKIKRVTSNILHMTHDLNVTYLNERDLDHILKNKGKTEEELHYQITLHLKILEFAKQKFQFMD